MSGAVSFVLSLLGLGASGAVSAEQSMSDKKRASQLPSVQCWNTDSETRQMRERVYKEWMSLHGGGLNCLDKWPSEYPGGPYQHSHHRNWFRAHLEAQKIPYDDEILDEVTGINGERARKQMLENTCRRAHRGWF